MSMFELNRHEVNSALWQKLEEHFKERMDIYRSQNDNDLNEKDTARIRARINVYKELLKLGDVGRETD